MVSVDKRDVRASSGLRVVGSMMSHPASRSQGADTVRLFISLRVASSYLKTAKGQPPFGKRSPEDEPNDKLPSRVHLIMPPLNRRRRRRILRERIK